MRCLICDLVDDDTNLFISCDSCNRSLHKISCSDLSSSEIRVMELKNKRSLKFYCPDCLSGLLHIPKLIKAIDELTTRVQQLELKQSAVPPTNSDPSTGGMAHDDMLQEIHDRQKRANNLMLFNLPENGNDAEDVRKLLMGITNFSPRDLTRQGKPNKNGWRSLRAVFSSSHEVESILKCRSKLKGTKVFVGTDMTVRQRELDKRIRSELDTRLNNGEKNLQIVYRGGVPRLINRKN